MAVSNPSVRVLGNVFDGLVRSARARMPTVSSIANRAAELWSELPDATFRLEATRLFVDDTVVLEAGPEEGRWLLPAYMAGLRAVRRTTFMVPGDLHRLAEELAGLESTVTAIGRFRDWLWADGAEGFEVAVDDSFSEDGDLLFMDAETGRHDLLAMRMAAAAAFSLVESRIASSDLDAAVTRAEFHVPIDDYVRSAGVGRLCLSDENRRELAQRCEDSTAWGDAQVFLALAYPALQSALPPETLARRLAALAATGAGARILNLVRTLVARDTAESKALLEAMQSAGLGQILAAGLEPDEASGEALAALLDTHLELVTELLRGLLRRCPTQQPLARFVGRLIRIAGPAAFSNAVVPGTIGSDEAFVLVKILQHLNIPDKSLAELLILVPADALLRLTGSLSTPVLCRLTERLERILSEAVADDSGPALLRLVKRDHPLLTDLVGRMFAGSLKESWNRQTCSTVLAGLARHSTGRKHLVSLVRNRTADSTLRLMALDLLDDDPEAQAIAVRRSLKEAFEPPEVKARIRQKRRRLSEVDDG